MTESKPVVVLRDLPGVAWLEENCCPGHYETPKEKEKFASESERISNEIFGFTEKDTRYRFSAELEEFSSQFYIGPEYLEPHMLNGAPAAIAGEYKHFREWEKHFAIADYWAIQEHGINEKTIIEMFLSIGWNITDENGDLLSVFEAFARQIIVKALSLSLPACYGDSTPLTVEKWAQKVAADAAEFRNKRKA